uniref:Nuclear pore complex protein Nup85 n=1 Tax=Syphacia muris TaxID=451379 RepID=A0A0N5AW34_9BILA
MTGEEFWVAADTVPEGIVLAISQVESKTKNDLPKGKFLKAVLLKHSPLRKFDSPALQQLVYESHATFRRAQNQQRQSEMNTNDILSLSMEYRSIIRSVLSSIQNPEDETYNLLSSWELIWALVETVFLKPTNFSIVADLIGWARIYLTRTDYVEEITTNLRPRLFVNASRLTKTYSNLVKDPAVERLTAILDLFNINAICEGDSEGELPKLRRNIQEIIESGELKKGTEPYQIAMLLMGHVPSIKMMSSCFSSWFEIFPLYALLCKPSATLEELPELVKECRELWSLKEESEIDAIVSAICSMDALLVVQNIARANSDWWLAAHLADLLQKADSNLLTAYGVDTRQPLVMEYGIQLFSEAGLCLIGFDYLLECGNEGKDNLELLLSNLQIDNEVLALKLISRCAEENLLSLVCYIERSVALRYLSTGQWSSALIWGMRTEDSKLIDKIANRILLECPPEAISRMSILDELSEVTLLSSSLVFLHKYYCFRKLFASAQREAAAQCLIDLITSGRGPLRLRSGLFNDLSVILSFDSEKRSLLDRDTTYNILQYLTRCDVKEFSEEHDVKETEIVAENLEGLRLSLLNSLCKSFML